MYHFGGKKNFIVVFFFFLIQCILFSQALAIDLYVDSVVGNDSYTGLSWSEAKASVTAALALGGSMTGPDTIHVAQGVYEGKLFLVSETTLLGGYPTGGGTRNPEFYETRIGNPPYQYEAVIIAEAVHSVIFDGFIINGTRGFWNDEGRDQEGGGIYCKDSEIVISNNIITNNQAVGGDGSRYTTIYCGSGLGGGIYAMNGNISIVGNIISGNKVEGGDFPEHPTYWGYGGNGHGGGIYVRDATSCIIADNIINNNSANSGFGIHACGNAQGGGIWATGTGTLVIERNIIKNNSVHKNPGTCYLERVSGGGIYSNGIIVNNIIVSNTSQDDGGGVTCSNQVINNTFVANSASKGSGIENTGAEIINNIFYNHDSRVIEGTPFLINNNNFYNNLEIYFDGVTVYSDVSTLNSSVPFASANISCPPHFKNPLLSDYHLKSTSCCIDAGTFDNAPSYDMDNDVRPNGPSIDIGADEYYITPNVPFLTGWFVLVLMAGLVMTYLLNGFTNL